MRWLVAAGFLISAALLSSADAAPFKTLHTFCSQTNCRDGQVPGELVADGAGNLYGVAQEKGAYHGHGVIFELVGGTHFKVLYTFCEHGLHNVCPNGSTPQNLLTIDTAGNLYGVTNQGGANGAGTAFELVPDALHTVWTLTTLHDFCGGSDPACPNNVGVPGGGFAYAGSASDAAYDGTSPLYGVTSGSFAASGLAGAVYALTPGTPWTTSLVYAFCQQANCADGAIPQNTLAMDAAGNLFGNTSTGGASPAGGVAFELTPPSGGSWTETVLHSFCDGAQPVCADGLGPTGRVVLDADGNLYGTTEAGGRLCQGPGYESGQTCGVIYKIVPNGTNSVETVLRKFCMKMNCTDGSVPVGGLAIDAVGTLYGTTQFGGGNAGLEAAGPGVLFSLQGSTYTVLHRFCAFADCSDGQLSQNAPFIGRTGIIYGQTDTTLFRFMP